jgi:DNA replication and repair protein RecF
MFSEINIHNLRVFKEAQFRPAVGLNVVTGRNGAGKTSLLEAAYLLATGRSFRHRETQPLIREGCAAVELFARFSDVSGQAHVLGMRRGKKDLTVRLDGRNRVRRSEILQLLPVQFIGSDPQQMVSGPPELRRGFLDSGLFHVEPGYLATAQQYARALSQRNAALRAGQNGYKEWDFQLSEYGEHLDQARSRYIRQVTEQLDLILADWGLDADVAFSYRRGWSQQASLSEALERMAETDRRQHFTSVGPHRADLVITSRAARGGKVLSRGQLKMLVVAMHLAQARVQAAVRPMQALLFDDIGAELDEGNRALLLESISAHYPQVIVTALDPIKLEASTSTVTMFHVEHGTIAPAA